jgi:hypothetical protein
MQLMVAGQGRRHGPSVSLLLTSRSEGVEDLTGGITTEIISEDVLDKDLLWKDGLLEVNRHFLFGAGTRGTFSVQLFLSRRSSASRSFLRLPLE